MSDYTEQSFDNSNIIENKINTLDQNKQKKVVGLATGKWESAVLESYSDADSPTIVGVTGGVGKGGNLSGILTEDRDTGFDAYEVAHPNDPYRNTQSGIAKYERQRQRLESDIQRDPSLASKLGIKNPSNITDDDIARAGTREQLLGLYNLLPGNKQPWEPGPLDYYDSKHALELGSKENPLNIPVERKTSGEYDYFGRPLAQVRNKDTKIDTVSALDYDGKEDVSYNPNKAVERLRADGKLTPELEKYLTKANRDYTPAQQITDFSGSTAYMGPVRQSVTDRLASAPGAFAGSVAGGVVGVADFLTGGRVIGGENVDAVERTVGKKLGYDKALYKYDDAQRQKLMEETFKDVQALNPESYKNVDKEKAVELFKDGVTDPILLAQSLGVLVGGAGVGGAGIKVGVKTLTKGDEIVAAANKAKEVVEANKTLSAADKAAEIAKIDAGITVADKIGNLAVKGSGAAGYGATMTSGDIEEYAKNNNGELPGAGRILGMFAANTLAVAVPEIASAKFALGLGKAEEEARKATVGRVVGTSLGHVAASGIVELPQETIQAVVQTVNQRLGTEKYKDQSVGEIVNGATADILGQGLLGAAGGVAMGGLKPAADVVKGGMNLGGELVDEVRDRVGFNDPIGLDDKRATYNMKDYSGIPEEDRATKSNDVIKYAALMITDPDEAKANGYEKGKVPIDEVVDKVAKINGIADEHKKFIYKDVIEGIKDTMKSYSEGKTEAKLNVFKELVKETEGNKAASKAVENAVEDLVAEEMETVSAKISDAFEKHIDLSTVKISEEEMAKINRVVEQLRMMGSEELTDKAKAIEDVIKGLGKKKTYAEVRNDIKKAGFIFFGKSYKSLEAHEDDISREIAIGKDTKESEKLAEFVNSRADLRVRFENEVNGVIKDRNLSELKAFAEINNTDNKDILKTIETLVSKAKDGTRTKEILEASKERLEKTIAKYEGMSKASNVDEFKEIYSGKEVKPKVEEVKEDVEAKQKAFVAKIINKADNVDQALAVLNNSKNIHKVPVEVRSNLEGIIRNAEKFKGVTTQEIKEPEVKDEEIEEVIQEIVKKTTEKEKSRRPIHSSLVGKVILANSGIGKSYAKRLYNNIVDGDDLFKDAANFVLEKYGQSNYKIDSVANMRSIFELWGEYSDDKNRVTDAKKKREEVYKKYAELAKESAKNGMTVLSSSAREPLINIADLAIVQNDAETIAKNRASSLRENKEKFSVVKAKEKIESFKAKITGIKTIHLSKGQYFSEILEKGIDNKLLTIDNPDESITKQEPKVVDKELERVSKPVVDVETTMTDLEYYTQAENWSKEANEKAKADLKATNERLREIYRELDVISSEKEHVKKAIGDVKEKIRTISRKIRETNKKLDKYDSLSWKVVAEVMNGIKKMIKDTYKLLYRLLKAKAIKEYRAERLFKTLERLNEDKRQLLEELKSLKETKAEQKAIVESEAQELREVRRQLAEAKKIVFGATYGEESAKLFKKVDDEKVTVTNKFSEEFLKIQESNSRVGQTNDKKRVIEEATVRIAEELVGLMPKSVLRIMDKKPEFIKNAMKTFMDYRYGTNKKVNVPVQSKGSALEFLNDWLKNPELSNRLHVALDVVGMITIDNMMNVRTLNSSMLEDMIEGAFGVRSDEPAFKVIKRDLQKGKYVPMSTFTKEAGARVVRELGLKFDNEQLSMQDKQDVQFALGQLVIERAKLQMSEEIGPKTIGISASSITLKREDGQVMSAEITKGYEEGRDTTDIKRVVDLSGVQNVRGLREVTSVLEYAGEQSDGELKFEPTVIKEGTKVRNSNVEMSKDAVEYINRNNKIAWKFSDEFKELLVKATEEAKRKGISVNELMYELILDDINDLGEKTVDDVESELAKREAEKLEIDRMLMGYELAGSNEFYLDWDQTISGRYMIANKMINPQNSKIVRFLVQTDDMKSVLTRGENGYSGKDIAVVKGAIAQAFGYGIDKDSDANVFVKMAKELVGINENGTEVTFPKDSKLREAVKKYKELDIVGAVRVLKDMGLEVNERMHAMQALKVINGLVEGQKRINHGLVVEVDAITNGMILTLMEEGSEESMEMLVKGGIYWGNNYGKYRNHGEFKQDGGVDIYQTPVETLVGKMDTGTVVGNMLVELLSKDGKPDMGKWRNALKPLVMVYIYGAGMKSIISKAGTEFSELLMRSYIKNGDFESMSVLLNEAGINTKSMEFVDKKRLVGGTLTVTKGVLSKVNMGNVRLTPYQNYQLSNKVVESMGQAIDESFEENFEAISKYRKVLKTVEVMNYVVFKQELDRLAGDRESITVAELDKVLEKMQKEGTYYGARNSSGSIQDYVKLGDSGSKAIKVTGFRNKAATGSTSEITVNSALKWFVSNIGAVGVTAIHDKDGRVMEESDQDGTLNVYDAKIMPANFKVSNENSIRMNQAIVDVSREHSVLAEAVEKLDRLMKKVDTGKISRELTEEIVNDMNRVFGEGEWISGVGLVEQLKELRDNRTNNVGKPMDVNHVYALDSLDGVKAREGDVRTIELTDAEIEGLGKVYGEVVGKVIKNIQEKMLEKDIDERLERQGMSQENKSIIDNELKKADTNILSVIRQLVEGCK